jgi:hypothetical protein
MKNKLIALILLIAAGLIAACTANGSNDMPSGAPVFPTATNSFLFEGNASIGPLDAPVSMAGAPTVAGVFRTPLTATPSPTDLPVTATLPAQATATLQPAPKPYQVLIYGESVNPNWEVQKRTGMNFKLDSTGQTYRGNNAISTTPRGRGDAALTFTVSGKSDEVYQRDQVNKLSFALFSPKAPLYLDQFSVSILGSNSRIYWSADDKSVKPAGSGSIFPELRLDELGFNGVIPADKWVLVEIDLDKALAREPKYQYVTGISLISTAGSTHPLLIDDVRLTLVGQPPTPLDLLFTPSPN